MNSVEIMKLKLQSFMASVASIKMKLDTTTDESHILGLEKLLQDTEGEIADLKKKIRETESSSNWYTTGSMQTVSVTNDDSDNAEITFTERNSKVMVDGKSDHNGHSDTKDGHGVNVRYENHKGKQRSRKRRPKKKGSKKLKRPENLCKYLFTKRDVIRRIVNSIMVNGLVAEEPPVLQSPIHKFQM